MAENSLINSITESVGEGHIDFSVNINPLGIPDTVKRQFAEITEISGAYPDPDCRYLCSLLAEKYRIDTGRILCGNGADDLLVPPCICGKAEACRCHRADIRGIRPCA